MTYHKHYTILIHCLYTMIVYHVLTEKFNIIFTIGEDKVHFSKHNSLKINGHEDIDFVDINLTTDTRLFIDPFLIEGRRNSFAQQCEYIMTSFFECIFVQCMNNDNHSLSALLDFGHEPNETKLGLSRNQSSGRGASKEILLDIFKQISNKKFLTNGLIQNPKDLCLFVENFAEDRMSDLVTNILRKQLYDFTRQQCQKHNIPLGNTKEILGNYWDPATNSWAELKDYPLKVADLSILLVPKNFVARRYVYSVGQYLQHRILTQRQSFHQENETRLAKLIVDKQGNRSFGKPSKREVYQHEVKGTKHKIFVVKYSQDNPEALKDFRTSMHRLATSSDLTLSDEELDMIVYKRRLAKAS